MLITIISLQVNKSFWFCLFLKYTCVFEKQIMFAFLIRTYTPIVVLFLTYVYMCC